MGATINMLFLQTATIPIKSIGTCPISATKTSYYNQRRHHFLFVCGQSFPHACEIDSSKQAGWAKLHYIILSNLKRKTFLIRATDRLLRLYFRFRPTAFRQSRSRFDFVKTDLRFAAFNISKAASRTIRLDYIETRPRQSRAGLSAAFFVQSKKAAKSIQSFLNSKHLLLKYFSFQKSNRLSVFRSLVISIPIRSVDNSCHLFFSIFSTRPRNRQKQPSWMSQFTFHHTIQS